MHLSYSVLVLLLAVVCGVTATDICKTCVCRLPTVYCNCNINQNLTVSQGDLNKVRNMKKLSISLCDSVDFLKNSFAEARDLESLHVQSVNKVTFRMGVFSALKSLLVEDVKELSLEEKAFMGVDDLSTLTVRRTYIPTIPKFALYDMKKVKLLEMEDVVVDTVKSKAVLLDMDKGNPVVFHKCVINKVEEHGLVLMPGQDVTVTNSRLSNVAENGVNITSDRGSVLLKNNHITTSVSDNGVFIRGGDITAYNNTIERLSKRFLTSLHGKLSFLNNTILENDVDWTELASLSTNVMHNRLPCHCSQMSALVPMDGDITVLKNNYCFAPCDLYIHTFLMACSAMSDNEDVRGEHLCTISTTPRSPRDLTVTTAKPRRTPPSPAAQGSSAVEVSTSISLVMFLMAALLLR